MLRKANKAALSMELAKLGVVVYENGFNNASIIDAMAIVQKMVVKYKTFSDIAKSEFEFIADLKQSKHIDAENIEQYKCGEKQTIIFLDLTF